MARARKQAKEQASNKGSQLAQNAAAQNIKCSVCLQVSGALS